MRILRQLIINKECEMLENLLGKEFYNAYFHYIIGACILIMGIIVGNIVVSLLKRVLRHEESSSESKAQINAIIHKIHFPINLVFISLAIYAVHHLGDFPKMLEPYLLKSVKVALDISFFMTLYYFVGAAVFRLLSKILGDEVNKTSKELLANAAKMIVAILGVVTVLGNFDINIGPVLGGLTVLTSAVAFAAKDSIQGLIGSLTVVLEGKFNEGDWIKMGELQGFVENIGIRTTSIRGFDKTLTVLPNDAFVAGAITNFSRVTNWEINEKFVLAHTSTQDQLEQIVSKFRNWLESSPDIETDPNKAILVVRIDSLDQHGFRLFLMFFTKTNQWPEHMRVREQVMFSLMKIVQEAGTYFAHPTHQVLLEEYAPLNKVVGEKREKARKSVKEVAPVAKATNSTKVKK